MHFYFKDNSRTHERKIPHFVLLDRAISFRQLYSLTKCNIKINIVIIVLHSLKHRIKKIQFQFSFRYFKRFSSDSVN